MASLLAQLPGPINLRLVLSDTKFSDILHDLVTAKGNRSGVPRVLAVDRNEPRELAGTLHLEAPGVPVYSYSYSYTANIIPVMTSATAPSGTASADSQYSDDYSAWKAFNHTNAGSTDNWISAITSFPHSLTYEFPAAHIITQYAVTSRPDADAFPSAWTFEGYNGSTWDVLDTRSGITTWAAGEKKTYPVTSPASYTKCRLNFSAGKYTTHVSVGELEMMETTETTETISGYSSGKDDAIAQIRAINALVTVGTTLTLQSTGATNSVTLNILPSRGVSQPLDELFELDGGPVLASCAFSFTCEPYAYGPTVTIFDATITAPCIVDLGTVPGDYPAPLNMQFNTNSTGFHAIYCGLRRPGSADDIATNYLHEGEGMTWSGGSTGTSVKETAHFGLVRYNNSLSYATGVTPDDVSPGTYMILARLYVDGAGNSGYVKAPIVGQFAYPNIDALDLYELGCAHLPSRRILGGAGSSHSIMMASGIAGGGNVVVLDYEAFVPTSWGYFRWHPLAATVVDPDPRAAFAAKLNVNADGSVYVGDIANLADFRGAPISCVGPSQLVVFAEDHQQAQGCMLNFSASVTPRYALWR